ncbi:MAG TPA: DUF4349 domain-containing protein, partial [Solirubrobacterales bacterium]
MEPLRDDQLIADLQALRPTPRPQFAAELDERTAAGFPRRSRLRLELPSLPSLRPLIPAGGVAAILLAVVVALSAGGGSESSQGGEHFSESPSSPPKAATNQAAPNASQGAAAAQESSGTPYGAEAEALPSEESVRPFNRNIHPGLHHRAVERSAEVTLAADPKDVNDDASRVFEAVHANNGIVMRSSTQEGRPGEAGATFDLLIPSGKLDDAMAAFSEIDAVRSRHEATADITAPTVTAAELLKESRARIDSLLGQLEAAETEEEQEAIEAELRHERRHASRLAAQLTHLHKRADFSRISLRIETGGKESSSGGAWGIGDALHDAGHVLTVVAAVLLIALAVLGP